MTHSKQTVIAVMEDLMFMVRIQEAAKRAGLETLVVKTNADAVRVVAEQPLLVVIDLNYSAAEPLQLIQALKADQNTSAVPLLAFVSHVQTELRAAAVAAGCDMVLARSAFVQSLPEIMKRVSSG